MRTLSDLYYHMLQDVLHAEKQVLKLYPQLARKVSNGELATAITDDRDAIGDRVATLEAAFDAIGKRAKAVPCEAMKGLVEEAEEVLDDADIQALDAGVLAAVQAIKHYEITRFGTLSSWAMQTGQPDGQAQFQQCADTCREMDEELTRLAEATVNVDADADDGDSEDDSDGDTATKTRATTKKPAASKKPKAK